MHILMVSYPKFQIFVTFFRFLFFFIALLMLPFYPLYSAIIFIFDYIYRLCMYINVLELRLDPDLKEKVGNEIWYLRRSEEKLSKVFAKFSATWDKYVAENPDVHRELELQRKKDFERDRRKFKVFFPVQKRMLHTSARLYMKKISDEFQVAKFYDLMTEVVTRVNKTQQGSKFLSFSPQGFKASTTALAAELFFKNSSRVLRPSDFASFHDYRRYLYYLSFDLQVSSLKAGHLSLDKLSSYMPLVKNYEQLKLLSSSKTLTFDKALPLIEESYNASENFKVEFFAKVDSGEKRTVGYWPWILTLFGIGGTAATGIGDHIVDKALEDIELFPKSKQAVARASEKALQPLDVDDPVAQIMDQPASSNSNRDRSNSI